MAIKIEQGYISTLSKIEKKRVKPEKKVDLNFYRGVVSNKTGKGVKVCLIDTGYPDNPYIIEARKNSISCTETPLQTNKDRDGHATYTASVIKRLSQDEYGISHNCELYYAAVFDKGSISYSSVITAILWCISTHIDIICMPISANYDFLMLERTIAKAIKNNICIFAPVDGNDIYPGVYDGVYSIGKNSKSRKQIKDIKYFNFDINDKNVYLSGISLYCALYAGLAANLIEDYSKKKKKYKIEDIYSKLDLIREI